MANNKRLLPAVAVAVFAFPAISFAAFDVGTFRADLDASLSRLIAKYEARIAELEAENAKLKSDLSALKGGSSAQPSANAPTPSSGQLQPAPLDDAVAANEPSKLTTPAKTESSSQPPVSWAAISPNTGNAEYDAVMKKVVADLPSILVANGIPANSQLGLFEFVNGTRAFFISLDDGKNPSGVTAFKNKILFSYDKNYKLSVLGVFDLNYAVERYVTVSGSNPYPGTARTRVKNPTYSGKLLDEVVSGGSTSPVAPSGASAPSGNGSVISADVTVKSVRAAYDKNKLDEAIRLATSYLAKDPTNVEILTIRYRSYYIKSKFAEALKDVQAIEAVQGANFDCTVAKDAGFIAKAAKNAELAAKYSGMCKKR